MSETKTFNRWLVVVGALLIQLCLGAIYAWSVFTPALKDPAGSFNFTATETQMIFSAGLATFAITMILAGKLQAKIGPRKVALAGGVVLGAGYLLGSIIGESMIGMLISVGIIGGAGIGLAYVCPIAVGIKWFPDKKGLITGLAVAGFGFGATIWVKLAGEWGHLLADYGVLGTFQIYGVIFLIMVTLGALTMVNPPEGYKPKGWVPSAPTAGDEKKLTKKLGTGAVHFESGQMLRTPQFYMIWAMFIFGALAGLMVIGIIKLFGIDALQASGMNAVEASAAAGTAMAVFYAISNGIGRIVWGIASDKIGCKLSLIIMFAIQGVMMLVFFNLGGHVYTLYLGAALIGFNFGGNFALFPTATAEFFGTKNVGQNYGWTFTAYGVGGVVGPMMAGYFKDAGATQGVDAWLPAFMIAGVLCFIAVGIGAALKTPKSPAGLKAAPAPKKEEVPEVPAPEPVEEAPIAEDSTVAVVEETPAPVEEALEPPADEEIPPPADEDV